MMKTGLGLLCILLSLLTAAQQKATPQTFLVVKPKPAASHYFVLLIDGKIYKSGDTLDKAELKMIAKSVKQEIVDTSTNHGYKIISSKAVIVESSKSSARTYTVPAGNYQLTDNYFERIIAQASSGDTYWLDAITYTISNALLPKQFYLTVK